MARKAKKGIVKEGRAETSVKPVPGNEENIARVLTKEEQRSQELLLENTKLKSLLSQLKNQMNDLSNSILLRGYLYKWKDNVMTFGTKWSLKYFILNGNLLNYYHSTGGSHAESYEQQPIRTINLKNCVILDEGKKGNYFIISICLKSETDHEMIRGPLSGSLLRLSSDNESNMKLWIDMLCKACEFGEEDGDEGENGGTAEEEHNPNKKIHKGSSEQRPSMQVHPPLSVPLFISMIEQKPTLSSSHPCRSILIPTKRYQESWEILRWLTEYSHSSTDLSSFSSCQSTKLSWIL